MRIFIFGAFEYRLGWGRPADIQQAAALKPNQKRRAVCEMDQNAGLRLMDDLGRIVIPRNICDEFGWNAGTKLRATISDTHVKTVLIREPLPLCSLCRKESDSLMRVEKGYVCPLCTAKIK